MQVAHQTKLDIIDINKLCWEQQGAGLMAVNQVTVMEAVKAQEIVKIMKTHLRKSGNDLVADLVLTKEKTLTVAKSSTIE